MILEHRIAVRVRHRPAVSERMRRSCQWRWHPNEMTVMGKEQAAAAAACRQLRGREPRELCLQAAGERRFPDARFRRPHRGKAGDVNLAPPKIQYCLNENFGL